MLEGMSKYGNNHSKSRRKPIKPLSDINDMEDDTRRDSSGRKRVDVIECLLDSSSDDSDYDRHAIDEMKHSILWLTFAEISHIRYVIAQRILSTLKLSKDKQYSRLINGDLCFRCRKLFPVRIQTLMKISSTVVFQKEYNSTIESNPKAKTICYDCLHLFEQYRKSSRYSIVIPMNDMIQSAVSQNSPDSNVFKNQLNAKVEQTEALTIAFI